MTTSTRTREPGLLDAVSLAAESVDVLVVQTARDLHQAVATRVRGAVPPTGAVPLAVHDALSASVYAGLGHGARAVSAGLGAAAAAGVGPPLESGRSGHHTRSVVNALWGDRIARERPALAIRMTARVDGADVPPDPAALAAAYPHATGRIAVLLHGLGESDRSWGRQRDEVGATYADTLTSLGWTAVVVRANTGLGLRENGAALAALLRDLTTAWPVDPTRIALIGHSMGGLIARAACAVATEEPRPWADLVTDVVTLGTPHLGAPAARWAGRGGELLARLPETRGLARVLDLRSAGVDDLRTGLGEDTPALPHARYRLVAASVGRARSLVGHVVGDLLVRVHSAHAHDLPLPDPEVLHLTGSHHFDLLNHPDVHEALRRWLG